MLLESVCRQKTAEFLTCLLHANYNCAVITYNTLSVVLLLSFTIDEVIWIKFTLNVPFSMQGKLNTKTDFQILQVFLTVHWFRAFIWFLLKNVHYHRVEFAHTNRKKNAFIFANFRFSRFKTKHYVMTGEKKNNLPFWILTKLQAFKSMGLRLTLESKVMESCVIWVGEKVMSSMWMFARSFISFPQNSCPKYGLECILWMDY